MIFNYLITTVRGFLRQPIYSTINIAGLILGLSCSLMIFLWALDELKYDRYHPDNDRVYRVMVNHNRGDGTISTDYWTPAVLAETLRTDFEEVENTGRMEWSDMKLFQFNGTGNYEYGCYADPSLFDVLNLSIVEGVKQNPLPDNNSVAISQKMAARYFKNGAVGQTMRLNNKKDVVVTAVFENLPEQSTEEFDFLLPYNLYLIEEDIPLDQWSNAGWHMTFVKLKDKKMQAQLDEKIKGIIRSHQPETKADIFLFPMMDWRLYSNFIDGKQSGGRINYFVSFILVAVFILLIACINFMNLSTARAANRSKEVGIRKVAGASRGMLLKQFLMESFVLSFISSAIALGIVYILLPPFNNFTGKHIILDLFDPVFGPGLLAITLLTGLLAGSYPAFFLSAFRPASVLKGNLASVFAGANLRRILVVFQFSLSVIIIAGAWVVYDQISYLRNRNLGFDRNHVIIIRSNEQLLANLNGFRNDLMTQPAIQSVALGAANPMEINGDAWFDWDGKAAGDETFFNIANCDYDYVPTLGFELIKGRNFSKDFPSDSSALIVTEEVVRKIGFQNPIGQELRDGKFKVHIIGVIKDFHNLGIHDAFNPTVLCLGKREEFGRWAEIFIRYEPGQLSEAIAQVKGAYIKSSPDFPIQMNFLDESFDKQFRTENMVAVLTGWFTVLAVLISCLGLFGLALFNTERRVKEIGIRKVLGASVSGLVALLCRDFIRLVVYAIVIGSPIAYWVMDEFLKRYPYHTELGLTAFAVPALLILFVSLLIIGWQSAKAALANPVEALRSE